MKDQDFAMVQGNTDHYNSMKDDYHTFAYFSDFATFNYTGMITEYAGLLGFSKSDEQEKMRQMVSDLRASKVGAGK